jgi:hypothetical protein
MKALPRGVACIARTVPISDGILTLAGSQA